LAGCCEHGKEPSGSIKGVVISSLDEWLLESKKDCCIELVTCAYFVNFFVDYKIPTWQTREDYIYLSFHGNK